MLGTGLVRPFLTVNVFGSKGCGKTAFKTQWFDSSQARAVSEIADVHIRIQRDCSYSVMDFIRNAAGLDGGKHHTFVVIYRPDDEESIKYGQAVLDKVYTTFDYTSQVNITFIENHFEKEFKPHSEEPTEFPLGLDQRAALASRNPPQLWRVVLSSGVQASAALDKIITQPLLEILDTFAKDKLMRRACVEGRVEVLKMLAGTCSEINSMLLISHSMASLELQLQAGTPPDSSKTTPLDSLMGVAYYLYYVDPTMVLSSIARSALQYPLASLRLMREFCKQTSQAQHLVMVGVALTSIPTPWVTGTPLTHINLGNNLLTSVPEEVFQISTLQGLNLGRNCLEGLPSVLRWNCPKLRELDISHNRLVSKPYTILEGRIKREPPIDSNPPSLGKQRIVITAAQALLQLTGYNLYPCLCSITRVSMGHNPALTQIPEWVCVLPSLTLLEMKGLPRLTTLTPHLVHCRSLCLLQLDSAHLISPPPNIALKGTRHILTYLRCQLRGSTPYRHIKLVIVGEKGAGKSTLFRQFVRGSAHADPTSPMDVASFEFPSRIRVRRNRPRVTFHVIDFAGDQVYRCTHNCFLTYRSIYLCMWNITGGKSSLQRLCPWLHSIQACVPGSPVLLVATHANRRPGLSAETILQWEDEVLGKPVQLKNKTTARGLGFPPIMQSVVMDCLSREDIDMLLDDLYNIALQMRHPQTNVPLMSDLLPRSYQELQTLVEVKVRSLCLERRVAPVMRHEELVDYVRSLTISNPNGLEQDEEEFALACHFLHEAGAIVQYRSQVAGVSDLYFLDPQWLFNALATVIKACGQGDRTNAVVNNGEWPHFFQRAGIPVSAYSNFLSMMEHFNIIVSLDFERNSFLLPVLLPETPPPNYPTYDLSSDLDEVIVQYIELEYLPPPLFPQLIARVVLYIRQLSGQLLSIATASSREERLAGAENGAGQDAHIQSSVTSLSTLTRRSQTFHVDKRGYLSQDDLSVAGQDEGERLRKIWGLTTANPPSSALPDIRYRHLMQKLVAISQPILNRQGSGFASVPPPSSTESSHSDQFANYVVWRKGLFCEFPCGTTFWLEACENAIALVISGELVHRVKVLSFLSSSVDALLDECYLGLKVVSYSPCPTCLRDFWTSNINSDNEQNLAISSFEQSGRVQINEFNESILYLHRRQPDSSPSTDQSQGSFSGSKFSLSMSPSPNPDSTHFDETPRVAMLERTLTLFPLSTTVQQSVMSSSILCPSCKVKVRLESISPHVLLVDFKHSLLLHAKQLHFNEDAASTLGKGGFGKVFAGTYEGQRVAVKVFRKGYHEDVLLRRYKDLREELTIMSQLQHPRVVALVGVCLKPLAMVLKLAPLGSLRNHIDLCPHGMQSCVTHQVLYQLADGLRYLHSLYIVHRDIKPSNILVWELHPLKGVDVKLADYGVSQFYSPAGLRRHKGTEEYMAPELFHDKRKLAYDEKVDVFSFGLVLHAVVTGRRLFASIMNKREQLHLLYHSDFPQLSSALAHGLSDNKPLPTSPVSKFPSLLEEGAGHPAGRLDVISACHSVCMQPLLESCLASTPRERPSAQGLCSWLLVCPGATAQRDYYISAPVLATSYSPKEKLLVAIQGDRLDHVTLFPSHSWQIKRCPTPYSGQQFSCVEVVGSELFLTARDSLLLYSLQLPSLQSGHISSTPLVGAPSCLFSCQGPHGPTLVVGMSRARLAVYSSPQPQPGGGGGASPWQPQHLLDTQPQVTQVLAHPDAQKNAIGCGLSYGNTLWCGCGTYLIGLDPKDLLIKHYKPIILEGEATLMAASHDYVWVGFRDKSLLVLCSVYRPNDRETLDCYSILGQQNMPPTEAVVSAIASGPTALWVGTKGGHLVAFDPVTADVLVVHHKPSSISFIMCLSAKRVVTFGEGVLGIRGEEEEEEERRDIVGMFTVWESYIE